MLEKLFAGGSEGQAPEIPLLFNLAEERALRVATDYEPLPAWRFFSHHIKRYPQDLRAHVQRILLAQDDSLKEHISGSLQDLFLALGDAGQMLRAHMYRLTQDDLSEEEQTFFQNWLDNGAEASNDHRWRPGSILSSGVGCESITLVDIQQSQETAQYNNVLEEVQMCLEYGQLDVAQELLEKEVLAGNTDENIEQELLNIYHHTQAKERLQQLGQQITDSGRELSSAWQTMLQQAESWS